MNITQDSSSSGLGSCEYITMAWSLAHVCLCPMFVFVLWVGVQKWRKPRPGSSSVTHTDVFTFNMAAVEMVGIVGYCLVTLMIYFWPNLPDVGDSLSILSTIGQTLFHVLVCVERYLAVVHPITYLHLRKRGVAIRNASILLVWLFSSGMAGVFHMKDPYLDMFIFVIIVVFSFVLVTFLCASVLYVLLRPGPGGRRSVDQSKRRAFQTVAIITAALMLKFVSLFVLYMVGLLERKLEDPQFCVLSESVRWFHFPSSFVMPGLFLCRHGKKYKTTQTNP